MARTHRFSTTVLIVSLACAQWSSTIFASEAGTSLKEASSSPSMVNSTSEMPPIAEPSSFILTDAILAASPSGVPGGAGPIWRSALKAVPAESSAYMQGGWGRGRGRRGAGQAAVVVGAVAAIAGTAVLVYANRPECSASQMASGCGYGTKVVGGAVLSAGLVGIIVGALTWR